ncbi:hypothetical protein NDU88_001500 [Pleurodeles waltl]|uniref:Uncharacterized protein n=1 Tax=Pleurodeles waltl TaxID=8319 RepID=A0AAV7MJX1_PLEWA|nr:hypothetical protein NDU88_001500 [Pleurodeles waltl]
MCNQKSKQYFPDNQGSVTSSEVIWEAQKAYLRAEIISYVKGQRERSRQKNRDLEERIMDLEDRYIEQEQDPPTRPTTFAETAAAGINTGSKGSVAGNSKQNISMGR